jgi:site-specific DNA recombinase
VWPAILDRETWDAVRAVLNDPSRRQPPPSRKYPLRGVLKCGECGHALTAMPSHSRRNYGCRKQSSGGCGHVNISADDAEACVFRLLVPLADHPGLKDAVRAEESVEATEARQLVTENAADEAMLVQFAADYADRVIPRATYLTQSARLRKRVDARHARLASMRGRTAIDRLNGHVAEQWDTLSTDEQRTTILALVTEITVSRHDRAHGNRFDPARLRFRWTFDGARSLLGESEGLALDEYGNLYEMSVEPWRP